jgi:two-component system sensor histidine kinase and response regulator WspE
MMLRAGYVADVAVDGLDGWNAVRAGQYDLVITDVDMPGLNGFALAKLIRDHSELKRLPIVIVSCKDQEEDRLRGLESGVDRYLSKSNFHEEALLRAVRDLIGGPDT